jgi:hypothetical protein
VSVCARTDAVGAANVSDTVKNQEAASGRVAHQRSVAITMPVPMQSTKMTQSRKRTNEARLSPNTSAQPTEDTAR